MTGLREFLEHMFYVEETSDHQRSIRLVNIMNALGFSTSEREIQRYQIQLYHVFHNIFPPSEEIKFAMKGSTADGMRGGFYSAKNHHDFDILFTHINIKLYNPRAHNIINVLLVLLQHIEEHYPSFFVEEDDNFPGYVKLAQVKTNCVYLDHSSMDDDKLYLSNSRMMDWLIDGLLKLSKASVPINFHSYLDVMKKCDTHGPAHTFYDDYVMRNRALDAVWCIHYDAWPNSANSFITRRRPNNWPSNSMLENIKGQGCDVAPVGHHDSDNNHIQWRLSFPGEHSLILDLTDVQILCYALIKIILRENLNTSQREVVSSFHVKHVMFWCVELSSCQWVDSNYINCLNICLTKLMEMTKARHIPHYIIESRNLFNSKMTEQMSTELVEVLSKYVTTHVGMLDAFKYVFEVTYFNTILLKHTAFTSTIIACFNAYSSSFCSTVKHSSVCWNRYLPHNARKSLLNYVNILKNLSKEKGVAFQYFVCLVRSMVGFLYYAKYKESNKAECLLASKRLIHKSLNLDNSCVKLRAATFLLSNLEYSESIEICDTFLTFPPRLRVDSGYIEYVRDILKQIV